MNTRKRYETFHDAQCDLLFNPAPLEESGPKYEPPVTVVYRWWDYRVTFAWLLILACVGTFFGAVAGGFWVVVFKLGGF